MKKISELTGDMEFPGLKNLFRIMKLTAFLILVSVVCVFANETYSQTKKINLDMKNVTVKEVLSGIEEQSEFHFMYSPKVIDANREVVIDAENAKIEEVLKSLFAGTDVEYTIKDRIIVLSTSAVINDLFNNQQQKSVTGKVTDSSGGSLPGVSVVVKGTTTGVITDNSGNYKIGIPDNATLQFSFVGMKTQEVAVENKTTINVVLVEETIGIEEVVAIGYGTQRKSDVTGSVSSVSKKDLGDRQVSSIAALIQGKAAGVDVTQGKMRIRGVTSFNNTDPLVVIDGFIGGNLSTVNPNDIENIEVLKDASSTAIYGSRGANGVVLVTTKAGKSGPLKVNINAYSGVANNPKILDVLNAQQFNDYELDALKNSNTTPSAKILSDAVKKDVTNWQDEVFRTAHNSELDVDFSGGSEKATFYFSMGYRSTQRIVIGPEQKDLYFRLVNDFKVLKWLKFGNNFALSYSNQKGQAPNLVQALNSLPYYPVLDPANSWGYSNVNRTTDMTDIQNPVVDTDLSFPDANNLGFQANLWTEINPLKGLVLRVQAGASGYSNRYRRWNDYFANGGANQSFTALSESSSYSLSPLIESYLTYSNKIGSHDFSLMAGNTWQNKSVRGGIGITSLNFNNTEVKNVFNAQSRSITNQDLINYAYLSYFGRLNYQYANKYMLTANLRRDASPRFAPSNRWGTFPSVALGWKMHEESFVKNLNVFDQLKFRLGWGVSGNDAIGDFRFLPLVNNYGIYYPLGDAQTNYTTGATIKDNYSADIKWEETESKNIGFDMAFLKNSLTFTFDYFIKDSKDILFTVPRSSSLGFGNDSGGDAVVNAASATNKGVEFQLGYRGSTGKLKYTINTNYTYINNEVTSLGLGQAYLSGDSRTDVGHPIGYYYGYVANGVIKTAAELDALNASARSTYKVANPSATDAQVAAIYYQLAATRAGDVKFADLNGDGRIDATKDRKDIGNAIPKHLFGLNLSLEYANFDLNLNFQGTGGYKIMNGQYKRLRSGTQMYNQESLVLNRWKSETDPGNGIQPRAVLNDPASNARASTLMVENGDYLRLRQISLGYTIPKLINNKIGISQLRIYVSSDNLFTITKYSGYDPEIGGDNNLTRGIDNYPIPTQRSFIVGVQLGL
jgi:TonB-linked SusC/RagA family outer membrane protein